MDVEILLTHSTPDCNEAVAQAIESYEPALIEAVSDIEPSPNILSLRFCLDLTNPLGRLNQELRPAEFDLSTGTYYVSFALNYYDWVARDWDRRMIALNEAVRGALDVTGPVRLDTPLCTAVARASDRALARARETPPPSLLQLRPVYLVFTDGEEGQPPGVAFEAPAHLAFGPWRFVEIPPHRVGESAALYFPKETDIPKTFRLYRRADKLVYHEAWIDGDRILEHWGTCGETGAIREHAVAGEAAQQRLLSALRETASRAGFVEIPLRRHRTIVATRAIVDMGTDADLNLRYELQNALDDELGSLGLGHCDGGSTGGGSMEVFCYVVDLDLGMAAITQTLKRPQFRSFVAVTGR